MTPQTPMSGVVQGRESGPPAARLMSGGRQQPGELVPDAAPTRKGGAGPTAARPAPPRADNEPPDLADDLIRFSDLVQQMTPVAAGLAVAVADREFTEVVRLLAPLDPHQQRILTLILASLVDVTKPLVIDPDLLAVLVLQPSDTLNQLRMNRIVEQASAAVGITAGAVWSGSFTHSAKRARKIACWVARSEGYSFPQIGRMIHRDHSTVIDNVRRVNSDPELKALAIRVRDYMRLAGPAAA